MVGVIRVFGEIRGKEALEFVAKVAVIGGFFAEIFEDVVDGLFSHADRGIRSRANQPCREWLVLRGFFTGACKQKGRVYTRPTTGTAKGPRRSAFNTPQAGRASSVVLRVEI